MNALRQGLIGAAFLIAASAAFGADLPTRKEPEPSPPQADTLSNSGFYTGAIAGGVFGGLTTTPGASSNSAGLATGALLGYKWGFSPWTFGVEGDIATNTLKQKFGASRGAPASQIESVYTIHARGRIGYQIGAFEPFIAGGFVLNDFTQSLQSPSEFIGASTRRPGWTIGAGVDGHYDLPFFGPATIRAEYLYDRLSATDLNLGGTVYRTGGSEHYARLAVIKTFDGKLASSSTGAVDWSGDYFGVLGGYAADRISSSGAHLNANGGTVGFYTGHNWVFDQAVVGVTGSTSFGSVNGDGPQQLAASTHYHDYFFTDVRGRAGWAVGRFLPYISAGLALDTSSQFDRLSGNYRGNVLQTSATGGLGLDYMFSDRIAFRGEYLYAHSVGTVKTKLNSEDCCAQTRESQSFRLGVAYFLR